MLNTLVITMQRYFSHREEIFRLAARIGVPISAIWYVYRWSETWNYFAVSWFRPLALAACIVVSFSPLCVIYMLLYLGNRFLVSRWGSGELESRQKEILRRLIIAHVAGSSIERQDDDLLDEYVWATLKPLLRRA